MRTDPDTGWRFQWRRNWDAVWAPEFADLWQRTFDAATDRHVYQRPAVVRAWAETCGAAIGVEPAVGICRGPAGATVILPWICLAARGRMAVRRQLAFAGDDLFGCHDPLAASGTALDWSSFWTAARDAVPGGCDQALFRFVRGAHADPGAPRTGDPSPVLRLDRFETFERLLASLSANHRGDLRRRRRRLVERGRVELWVPLPEEAERALDDWQARGAVAYGELWRGRTERNMAWRPGFDAFVARVIREGVRDGWGHYAALRLNDESIAWHVGLADRGRLYWWIPVHRPDQASYSPGKVLLAALVEHLIERRWSELHFQTGGHAYKLAWQPEVPDVRVVGWHAPSLRGTIFAWYDAVRRTA